MFLVEVGWHYEENESSICSTELNSMYPQHFRFLQHQCPWNHIPADTKGHCTTIIVHL
jgi:hypothetical protein